MHFSIIAHRGSHTHYFENTTEAILEAVDLADGVEFDIHLTQCGTPVIIHDSHLGRTHHLSLQISKLTLSQLQALPYFHPPHPKPYIISTLDAVMKHLPKDFLINIELKAHQPMPQRLVKNVAKVLTPHQSKSLLISSFNPMALLLFSYQMPSLPLGLLTDPNSHPTLAKGYAASLLKRRQLASFHPHFSQVNTQFMNRAQDYEVKVLPWTVNDLKEAQRLQSLGVSGLITDFPQKLKAELSS